MSASQEQLKKPNAGRAMLHGAGFGCLGVFFWGLAKFLWATESGSTMELVLGVPMMVFGSIGAAYVGWLVFTKRS